MFIIAYWAPVFFYFSLFFRPTCILNQRMTRMFQTNIFLSDCITQYIFNEIRTFQYQNIGRSSEKGFLKRRHSIEEPHLEDSDRVEQIDVRFSFIVSTVKIRAL